MSEAAGAFWINPGCRGGGLHRCFTDQIRQRWSLQEWSCLALEDHGEDLESVLSQLGLALSSQTRPVHLIGHGTGGVLAWWVARRVPQWVRSVTLLGVGAIPALNWQTYTLMMGYRSPCTREQLMAHMVRLLFGPQKMRQARQLVRLLEQDLAESLPPVAFLRSTPLGRDRPLSVPVLIAGGAQDWLTSSTQIRRWHPWLKAQDRVWICPEGYHFFHATASGPVADQVLLFWQQVDRERVGDRSGAQWITLGKISALSH